MPRTLAQNAQYIANTIKPAIKSAIEAQGVTVPSTDSFLDYADRIAEIEGGGSGYQLKDLPTGSISTVNDAAPLPLNALKVSVEAVQSGSGTPSPSNIRPIHGWDSGEISVVGKNFLNDSANNLEVGAIDGNAGWNVPSTTRVRNTIAYPFPLDDLIDNGYTWTIPSGFKMAIRCYDKDDNYITMSGSYIGFVSAIPPELYGKGVKYVRFVFAKTNDATITVDEVVNTGFQIELGNQATTYEPYQGKQYTQQFPTTIYGGEWDVVNGEMRLVHGYAEYDGSEDEIWTFSPSWSTSSISAFYLSADSSIYFPDWDYQSFAMCNELAPKTRNELYNTNESGIAMTGSLGNGNLSVKVPSTIATVSDLRTYLSNNPLQVRYKLATPTTIDLSPLSIRLLENTNHIYADCGEVIEGEYFVDEGAIDVRKVDYQIGSSGSIKTTDGRVLSGFASMNGYHARPLDASGNWLDVDWGKDFEIGVAFKFTSLSANQALFASADANRELVPTILWVASDATGQNQLRVLVSTDGSSWEVACITSFVPTVNTFYFIKMKYESATKKCITQVTSDFINWTVIENDTLANHPYYNGAGTAIGGRGGSSSWATNNLLIDTFNTYIKGDEVNWGAFTGIFPS